MAGLRGAVVARSRTSNAMRPQRRGMGFFSDLKKNLQDEVEKNKELKDALGKLNKSNRGGKAKPAEAAKPSEAESNAKASTDEAFQAAQENLNKVSITDSSESSEST